MLGTPSESFWHGDMQQEADDFWQRLKKFDEREYQMMAASHGQGEEQTALGVISGHAYSFIAVKEFMHEGKLVRLCMLRNPWGSGEWKGDWSDESPLWTLELREQVGCSISDDGTFHIPYEDYL